MNWLSKLDDVFNLIRDQAVHHWEVATAIAVVMSAFALFAIAKDPSRAGEMRKKARILRYCHSCPWSDLHTESCALYADANEKCGLVDKTAGMTFEVTKVE